MNQTASKKVSMYNRLGSMALPRQTCNAGTTACSIVGMRQPENFSDRTIGRRNGVPTPVIPIQCTVCPKTCPC